ncbi:hypothetical protein [Treponema denticola]|uniref:hypothetical protein n=1 Tax=Treponema denticola TaxID=158 RepID=UPI0002B51A6A|nr:hypothetical protein [Treponema denticola]EMB42299.1 hypothetical protein HMPREF9730_02621 [Treponema denticola AL-2]
MPNAATVKLPKTKDAYEFESMVADVLSKIYFTNFQTFGRQGQTQNGIDGLSNTSFDIVAQCKNFDLTNKDIDEILKKFTLEKTIKHFIIATSMNCDTNIQLYITELNTKQIYPFTIHVMFWNNITPYLYQYPELYQKYYGQNFNCTSIEDIKNCFNESIQKYHILTFLIRDIFVDGIPINLPTEAECFSTELIELLYQNLELQNEDIYKAIMNFCDALNKLNGYLGLHLIPSPDSRIYRYEPNLHENDTVKRHEISKNISTYMKMLDCFYRKINSGMTLFP